MKTFSTITRIVPATLLRRDRMLPSRGEVLVSMGDRVDAVDIIGKYRRPGRLVVVDAASTLRLGRRGLSNYLQKQPGDTVAPGDTLAAQPRLKGLFPRVLRSPVSGQVVAITDSQIVLETESDEAAVRAHIRGRVISVMPERGVAIETAASLIQGAWGVGEVSHGVLRAAVEEPDAILTEGGVDVSCLGAIVVGGAGVTEEALDQAEKMQARGLILGGISSGLIDQAASLPFPVLVTEGIGEHPLNPLVFEILLQHVGDEVSLDPGDLNPWRPRRPEIVIPLAAGGTPPSEAVLDTMLNLGNTVRVVRGPHKGVAGSIAAFPEHPVYYDIGLSLESAEIRTQSGEQIFVPTSNVEIVR